MQKSLTSLEAKKKRIEKRPLKTYESPQIIDGKNLLFDNKAIDNEHYIDGKILVKSFSQKYFACIGLCLNFAPDIHFNNFFKTKHDEKDFICCCSNNADMCFFLRIGTNSS